MKKKTSNNDRNAGESTLKWNIEHIKNKIVRWFDYSVWVSSQEIEKKYIKY